jgi:cobalt/nickel transport system permease protein
LGLIELSKKEPEGLLSPVDPRVKIMVLFVWSVVLALVKTRDAALLGLTGSLLMALIGAGGMLKRSFIKRLLAVNSFLLFVWLTLPWSFSIKGEPLFTLGPLTMTREGFDLSFLISIKALAIVTGAMAITSATSILELLAGARAMRVPEKAISLLLLMTRYITVVGEEYGRLRDAMKVRGFKAGFNKRSFKSIGNFCGMLLLRGIERAERVRAAMLCRGYKGKFWLRAHFQLKAQDFLFILFVMVFLSIIAAREFYD